MPTLTKRKGILRWRAQVWMNGRIIKSKWFGSGKAEQRLAILWEEEMKALLAQKKQSPIPTASLTAHAWATAHLDDVKRRCARSTYQEKRRALKRLLQHPSIDPEMPVSEITIQKARKYLQEQYDSRSGSATNSDRKYLAKAWNWGRTNLEGFPLDTLNPFKGVDRYPENRTPRYVPPEEDFWSIYDLSEGQDKVMLMAFLHLGARRGEIFRLTWADVDFPNSQIVLKTRKTGDSSWKANVLPMTSELRKELLWWWEHRENKGSEYVFTVLDRTPFTNQWEGQPFKGRQHFMKKLCQRAGVKPFGYHSIRHLSATILYKAGKPIRVIQQILRHESANTTARYLKNLGLDPEVIQAVDVFENRRPGKVLPLAKKKALGGAISEG